MSYIVLVRGPLGVGKSTVSKALARILKAEYLSIDSVLHKNKLDVIEEGQCIPVSNFIKANELVLPTIKKHQAKGKTVIVDGCFYHKRQILHLQKDIAQEIRVFTLKAPLAVCIQRDIIREKAYGKVAAKQVYSLVSRFEYGTAINTKDRTEAQVVRKILDNLLL